MKHRTLAGLAAALLLFGCASPGLPPDTATSPSEWRPPTQPAATAPASSAVPPSATTDPACLTAQMGNVLVWVEDQFKRGAFDRGGTANLDHTEVAAYHLALGVVEDKAGFEVHRATVKARATLNSFLAAPAGSEASRRLAAPVRSAMADLARVCGMDAALTFADG